MRRHHYQYDDFFGLDHRRECIHGSTKRCPECEAEGEKIARAQELRAWGERAMWAMIGFFACVVIDAARAVLT